ncbi:MAG: transposase [Chloroflexi bacterium]|nr:transposase [Chloroflexota bacterium]
MSDRVFVCEACGHTIDRDRNAAIPLKNTVSPTEMNACGEHVRSGDIAQALVGEAGTWQQASPGEMFV